MADHRVAGRLHQRSEMINEVLRAGQHSDQTTYSMGKKADFIGGAILRDSGDVSSRCRLDAVQEIFQPRDRLHTAVPRGPNGQRHPNDQEKHSCGDGRKIGRKNIVQREHMQSPAAQ